MNRELIMQLTQEMKTDKWKHIHEHLVELHTHIDKNKKTIHYQNQDAPYLGYRMINRKYRAIITLKQDAELSLIEKTIKDIEDILNSIPGSEQKTTPTYIPKFLTDKSIVKIQIHENIAHSSINYPKGKKDEQILVPIASWPHIKEKDLKEDISHAFNKLTKNGYEPVIEKDFVTTKILIPSYILCKQYNCKSIQHRRMSGKRITGSFFAVKDGVMQKSKRKPIGILLIPNDHIVEIYKSHSRKTRKDALYNKQVVNEITLKEVPKTISFGRIYAKH